MTLDAFRVCVVTSLHRPSYGIIETATKKAILSTTSFMMETLRDTAFGKLVRIFTFQRLLRYPEEIDSSICGEYLHDETKIEDLEAATSHEIEEDPFFGMYALMSQASRSSRSSRRLSSASTIPGPAVIDWRGLHDSEVRLFEAFSLIEMESWRFSDGIECSDFGYGGIESQVLEHSQKAFR